MAWRTDGLKKALGKVESSFGSSMCSREYRNSSGYWDMRKS